MVIHLKKTFFYSEADKEKRAAYLEELKNIDPTMIVYSDETGIDDNEVTMRGWSPKGQRCHASKRGFKRTRYNITAALNNNNLFAPFVFEGYSNAAVYETYIQKVLVPELKPGMVIVIDNARFHKSKKVIQLIEEAGCRVLFLPPYSPDLKPIEHHWFAVKNAIRAIAQEISDFYQATVNTLGELCHA